jgi:hypothetical protein
MYFNCTCTSLNLTYERYCITTQGANITDGSVYLYLVYICVCLQHNCGPKNPFSLTAEIGRFIFNDVVLSRAVVEGLTGRWRALAAIGLREWGIELFLVSYLSIMNFHFQFRFHARLTTNFASPVIIIMCCFVCLCFFMPPSNFPSSICFTTAACDCCFQSPVYVPKRPIRHGLFEQSAVHYIMLANVAFG